LQAARKRRAACLNLLNSATRGIGVWNASRSREDRGLSKTMIVPEPAVAPFPSSWMSPSIEMRPFGPLRRAGTSFKACPRQPGHGGLILSEHASARRRCSPRGRRDSRRRGLISMTPGVPPACGGVVRCRRQALPGFPAQSDEGRLGRLQRKSEREPVNGNVPDPLEDADDPVPQVTEDVAADDHRAQDRRPSTSPPASVNRTISTLSSAIATPFVRTALTTAPCRASLPNRCQAGPCRCHSGRSHGGTPRAGAPCGRANVAYWRASLIE
jgi:hypothetical protein